MAIVRRLAEIAHVATALRSWMAHEIKSSMHFEISGYAISYVMSDVHRTLSVLSVVPADAQ